MSIVEVTPAAIRMAAMNLLAMREQSASELQQKLIQKFARDDVVAEVIARLQQEGLQSDERFADAFTRMRQRQGKGPLLIAAELKAKGISSSLISASLDIFTDEWLELARQLRTKKFGQQQPTDMKEKARQSRFLAARGFSSAAIQYALRNEDY